MDILLSRLKAGTGVTASTGKELFNRQPDWRPGQVLQGRVAAMVAAGTYILQIEGQEILAASPMALPVGEAITLAIQERRGSQYKVKLLQPRSEQVADSLQLILDKLGLQDTPRNRSLIHGFLVQKLPLKQELIRQAEAMLHILGGHTREDMAIVMAALKRGLPPSPDVLHSLQAFIAGARGGGQHGILRLPGFIPFLAGLLAEQGGKEVRASHLYRQVLINLAALLLKPEEGAAKVMEQLRSLLAAQLPGGGEKGRGDAGQNYLPENTGSTTSRASGFNNLLAGFKLLLQEARESAGGSGRAAAGSSDQAILGEGEEIARQIAGQHLWQLPPKEGEGPDYLYFLLPLRQDGAVTEWGQLVIKKDSKGRGLIDPRDFSMTILLRTENLGPLLLDIKVWQKEIRVQGQVQEEWVGRLISKSWPALQDAFAGLGYHLHSYQWQAVPLIPGLLSRLLEPSPAGVPGLLDERV